MERGSAALMGEPVDATEIICCEGPPACPFSDQAAIDAQIAGCPRCRRIVVGPDGSETEYRQPAN